MQVLVLVSVVLMSVSVVPRVSVCLIIQCTCCKECFSIYSMASLNATPSLPLPGTGQREGDAFIKPFEQIEKNALHVCMCSFKVL